MPGEDAGPKAAAMSSRVVLVLATVTWGRALGKCISEGLLFGGLFPIKV